MSSLPVAKTKEDLLRLMLDVKQLEIAAELTQVELPGYVWADTAFTNFISAIMKHKTLKAMYLTGSRVSNAQYYALFAALKTHPSLKRLFLGKFLPAENHELVIERLSQYLQHNNVVRVLDLDTNYFNDLSTMQDIAKIIEFNRSLKAIHLSAVSMTTEGMQLVARAMKKNTTLLELNLAFNYQVDASGYAELFMALQHNVTLLKLDVTDLPLDKIVVDSLCEYLLKTKTLLCLRCSFRKTSINQLSLDAADSLNKRLLASYIKNTSLLNLQASFAKRDQYAAHLNENYNAARMQRNSVVIACITFARRFEDVLSIFPMEIWLNIFRFVPLWSRRYLRLRSSNILAFICDNIATINTHLSDRTKFRFVQLQKQNYTIKTLS